MQSTIIYAVTSLPTGEGERSVGAMEWRTDYAEAYSQLRSWLNEQADDTVQFDTIQLPFELNPLSDAQRDSVTSALDCLLGEYDLPEDYIQVDRFSFPPPVDDGEFDVTISVTITTEVRVRATNPETAAELLNQRSYPLPPEQEWSRSKDWAYRVYDAEGEEVYDSER